jgi:hypothetical protein
MNTLEVLPMTRTYDKPWMIPWIEAMQTHDLKPIEQTAGMALAYFADENGEADEFTWDEFGERAGIQPNTARRMWKGNMLTAIGLVTKVDRKIGNVMAMPKFLIHLPQPE